MFCDRPGGQKIGVVRGSAYFEAGFAVGLGIPVIWTCRKDAIDHLHFDTRQFNHIKWEKPADLMIQLADRLEAAIGEGPLKEVTSAYILQFRYLRSCFYLDISFITIQIKPYN